MISLMYAFWLFLILFAVIGAMRGWAKESLVIFSIILALFLIYVLENFTPFVVPFEQVLASVENISDQTTFPSLPTPLQEDIQTQFWIRAAIIMVLAFFGYQSPRLAPLSEKARREKIQDAMFGAVLGLVSGYVIIGTLWYYMDAALYPFAPNITPPQPGDPLGEAAINALNYLPPVFASNHIGLFFAVVIAFLFVLVVFI